MLGEGSFGVVYSVRSSHRDYAIKLFKNRPRIEFVTEHLVLNYIKSCGGHPNVVEYFGPVRDEINLLGLTFGLAERNLLEYCRIKGTLSLAKIIKITDQIVEALLFFKEKRIIHGDIKPENILLFNRSRLVKVTDFGLAIRGDVGTVHPIQTVWYRSPEVILELVYTQAIDMWSLACVIVEMIQGKVLFPQTKEYSLLALQEYVLSDGVSEKMVSSAALPIQQRVSESRSFLVSNKVKKLDAILGKNPLKELIKKMFVFSPEERLTPREYLCKRVGID